MISARLIPLFVLLTILSTPTLASAQDDGPFSEENLRIGTTIGVLCSTSTVYMLVEALSDSLVDQMFQNVSLHVKENAVALQQELALGGGHALADLGKIYDLSESEVTTFSRRARHQRHKITPMLHGNPLSHSEVLAITKVLLTPQQYARLDLPKK